MHKLARQPFLAIATDLAAILACDPLAVVPKLRDHLILFIQQGYTGLQFGNQKKVLVGLGIGRKPKALDGFLV